MAELVCPSGHQVVAVPGDGKDYTGVCDVCGRPMKVNAVNPVAAEYTHREAQRDVRESRPKGPGGQPSFEQLAPAAPKESENGT